MTPPAASAALAIRSRMGYHEIEATMTALEFIGTKRGEIIALAQRHGATDIRVFGSAARGEDGPSSDIGFLVKLEPGRSLLDLGALLMALKALLGREVDVVTEQGLRPRLRPRVLQEARPI